MPSILSTKLYVPSPRPDAVPRQRLIERLNVGVRRNLTLASAPAGFGKTTLISQWLSAGDRRCAWLSLDEQDSEPTRFWSYVVAALQTLESGVGEDMLGMLRSPQPAPAESLLTTLINDLSTVAKDFVLVLDDYHLIDNEAVDAGLRFLIAHAPSRMHLVIATREDPRLPLARWRVRDELTEVRASDLCFTAYEATAFLNEVMGLDLSAESIALLEHRTEGWIAGLQLAALSLQGRDDSHSFIQAFSGSHRFVFDYLAEEVLQRLPEHVRSFLLRTSILDRLCGPLCEAVLQAAPGYGQETLERLVRTNLLVVPLDSGRRWYRYHHLFTDVLRSRLRAERVAELPDLHSRASNWFENNDLPAAAVSHALAMADYQRVADLAEANWRSMDRNYQSGTWLEWVRALPDEVVRARPVISAGYGWALLDAGDMEGAEPRLRDAERCLEARSATGASTSNLSWTGHTSLPLLRARIASAWAYRARALGDPEGTATHARRALELLPEAEHFERGLAALLLGCASWAQGDLAGARVMVSDSVSSMWMAGNVPFAISFTSYLVEIMVGQGRILEAIRTYDDTLLRAAAQGRTDLKQTVVLHLGLGELHIERGDLETARRHLAQSEELGHLVAFPPWHRHWSQAWARMYEAQGNLDGALARLEEGERLAYRHVAPVVQPVAALKARLSIAKGDLVAATAWAIERNLSTRDEPTYLREFELMTLARLLIARHETDHAEPVVDEADELLAKLLRVAEAEARRWSVAQIRILRALAMQVKGNVVSALEHLDRAMALAEPEGCVRIFVSEGLTMALLLSEAAARGLRPGFVANLRRAFTTLGESESATPTMYPPGVEPLSERELEILRLVAQGLSNRDISKRLFRALDTIKGHNRRIFAKLQVRNRTEAVARARDLGLL